MDKSYVTITTCPICGKEKNELLLDRRLRSVFDMHTVSPEPCDKCRDKYLKTGVLLLEQTGRLIVLKDSAFKRIFNMPIPKRKIAFVEEGLLDKLEGLKK